MYNLQDLFHKTAKKNIQDNHFKPKFTPKKISVDAGWGPRQKIDIW